MTAEAYVRISQMRAQEGPADFARLLGQCRLKALGPEADIVFRDGYIKAGASLTPPPQLVIPLLRQMAVSLEGLSDQTRDPLDDLYLALFAFYGIVEIHPYRDGNGRTALALAEAILQRRWGLSSFMLPDEEQLHDVLGHMLTRRVPRSDDNSTQGVLRHAAEVAKSLQVGDLDQLKRCPALTCAVEYLGSLIAQRG